MDRVLPASLHKSISYFLFDVVYPLEKYAAPTVVLVPPFIKSAMETLSEATGQDVDTLEYILGMLICYPLGIILLKLPHGKIKHLFSFLLGAFLLQFTIGVQWVHQLITSLVAYVLFLTLPRSVTKTLVPAFAMIYMTLGHLHRQFINYLGYDLDFTGAQMVLTIKLYSIAYNLYDGELIAKNKADRAAKKCQEFALTELPGIIEFLGYTFCFSNILAGPAYEYKIYADACDGYLLYDKKTGKPKGKIPSNIFPALWPLFQSLIILVIFVIGNGKFPLLDPVNPQTQTPYILSETFLAMPFIKRYAYMWIGLFFIRHKYYFAWKNAEGAQNIWYAGFEGFDEQGNPKGWENSSNIDILAFETGSNVKTLSAVWNKKTALWLNRYVYIRTGGSLLATYGMSAFWHGFYPGYYFFFLSVPLLTFCERLGRAKLSPLFSTGGKWSPWGIVTMVSTSLIIEYMVVPFQLLAFDWSFACWKSFYFFGHIICIAFYVIVSMLPTPKKKVQ